MSDAVTIDLTGIVEPETIDVTDYDDVVFILRSAEFLALQPDAGSRGAYQSVFTHGTVIDIDGDAHFERRRLLSALVRRSNLVEYEHEFLIPEIRRNVAKVHGKTDLLLLTRRIMLGLMSRVTGIGELDEDDSTAFENAFGDMEHGLRIRYAADPEVFFGPAIAARTLLIERFMKPAFERHRRQLDAVARGEADAADLPNDLITLLLQNNEHYGQWDDDVMFREITVFINAAVGSTSNAICHAASDIDKWIAADPGTRADKIHDLDFLSLAFQESQRLHQANPVFRVAEVDTELPSGRTVTAGTLIALRRVPANAQVADRVPGQTDGLEYDPYREMPQGIATYALAFGTGRHMCLGRQLVLTDATTGGTSSSPRLGIGVGTLHGYYRSGMTLDADDPMELVQGVDRQTVKRCPAWFPAN